MKKERQALEFLGTHTSQLMLDRANIQVINFIIWYGVGRLLKIDRFGIGLLFKIKSEQELGPASYCNKRELSYKKIWGDHKNRSENDRILI